MNTKKIVKNVLLVLLAIFMATAQVNAVTNEENTIVDINNIGLPAAQTLTASPLSIFPGGFTSYKLVKTELLKPNIAHIQYDLYDSVNPLPIRIDAVWNMSIGHTNNRYWHPGTGLSSEADFLSNPEPVIIQVNKGTMWIGVSPRESQATDKTPDITFKNLNVYNHTLDFKKVIDFAQSGNNLPYEVGGHSAGVTEAEAYAAWVGTSKPQFKGIRGIDMVLRYPPGSNESKYAAAAADAYTKLMTAGVYSDSMDNSKGMALMSRINPKGDSGVPRAMINPIFKGNFTNNGLFHYALIYANAFPGITTPFTGIPENWNMKRGFFAGTYIFDASNPLNDKFSLKYTKLSTVYTMIDKLGSGKIPLAYEKDLNRIMAGSYPKALMNLSNIKVSTTIGNTGLGMGNYNPNIYMPNSKVNYFIIATYEHADPTSATAAQSVYWSKLIP